MKASYLFGVLLILATAISNMAMAQDPKTVRAMEGKTPQSIKDAMAKRAVHANNSRRLAPTSVRPLQMNASRSPKPIDDHVLRILLERRSRPNARPSQALANVNRSQGMSQPMMQGNRNQVHRSAQPTEQIRAAEREEMKTKMLARLKRKP
ncbi:MAG: hypothetical protein ACTHMC_08425 [Pseudobacter sp.]|uniref:hypothetical protein n=1 Tax=Pseudobacter sp. TaxID=2045420 RepID=UPI003F81E907